MLRRSQKSRETLGIIRNGAKTKTKRAVFFHIFNTDCNAGQGQFRIMQQSWKKYREGNYHVQRLGAAALSGKSEKAGERSPGTDD